MTKEELYRLTGKFLNETLSKEEKERLEQWYLQGVDEEITVNVPFESSYKDETALKENLLLQIRSAIANEGESEYNVSVVRRMPFFKTNWFRAAAAAVLIAGAGCYFWLSGKRDGQVIANVDKTLPTDVNPGGNKAVLAFGDKKQISLSSDKTGITVAGSITYNDGERIAEASEILKLSTPKGGQYRVSLPDGSKIWLNAASSVRFPSKFVGDERLIEVTGEAYLEVVQNSSLPFKVRANGVEVHVLGTSFNINAYNDESSMRTTLVEGSVKVVDKGRALVLRPGQQCSVNDKGGLVATSANIEQVLAWKNGLFSFHNADLATVLRHLERWYDIDIKYEGRIPDRHFNGELPRNLRLSQVISVLNELEVKFRIEGKTLIVSS